MREFCMATQNLICNSQPFCSWTTLNGPDLTNLLTFKPILSQPESSSKCIAASPKPEMMISGFGLLLLLLTYIHPSVNATFSFNIGFSFNHNFQNNRLQIAHGALQAWKKAITEDPLKITANWVGPNVCSYNGVFCAASLDDPNTNVVASIDLNHADLAGCIPPELGQLTDLAIIHLNSNRFSGFIPETFKNLTLLYELDVSNNRLGGCFPKVVLEVPSLKYLDLRFNEFEGELPKKLFEMDLDALFLNNNKFSSLIPDNVGNLNVSVAVLANNKFTGCIPPSIGNMKRLNEINFANNQLGGCLPNEMGRLANVTVIDISSNSFSGPMPDCLDGLKDLEILDVSGNELTGVVPDMVCGLSNLKNISIENNYFNGLGKSCEAARRKGLALDDSNNCLPEMSKQKDEKECKETMLKNVNCGHPKPQSRPQPRTPPVHSPPQPEVESTNFHSNIGSSANFRASSTHFWRSSTNFRRSSTHSHWSFSSRNP